MVLLLGEPPGISCDVGCCSSFHCCFCDVGCCCFYISGPPFHATSMPPWFLRPAKASTSSDLYPGYFRLLYFCVTFLPRARQFWAGIFYPQAFFTLHSFLTFLPEPAFVKASLGASSSSLKFSGRHADPQNTDWAYLFVWFTAMHNIDIQKNSHLNRIKYYQTLLVVTS